MSTPPELLALLEGSNDPDAMVLLQMAQIGADLQSRACKIQFEAITARLRG